MRAAHKFPLTAVSFDLTSTAEACDERGDNLSKIRGVVFGIVRRRQNVLAVAMASRVEEHTSKVPELCCDVSPDTAVAAVPMQADESDVTRGSTISARPNDLVREHRAGTADTKIPVGCVIERWHEPKVRARHKITDAIQCFVVCTVGRIV
jgi:hypothetical protein